MAQDLGYNRSNGAHEVSQRRTFWVLYFMEKVSCFTTGKVSVCLWHYFWPRKLLKRRFPGPARLKYQLRYSRCTRIYLWWLWLVFRLSAIRPPGVQDSQWLLTNNFTKPISFWIYYQGTRPSKRVGILASFYPGALSCRSVAQNSSIARTTRSASRPHDTLHVLSRTAHFILEPFAFQCNQGGPHARAAWSETQYDANCTLCFGTY